MSELMRQEQSFHQQEGIVERHIEHCEYLPNTSDNGGEMLSFLYL